MKELPHEKMKRDESEYGAERARDYAVSCSQHELADEQELRAAFYAGFKSACAYLRAPGIGRAAIVNEMLDKLYSLCAQGSYQETIERVFSRFEGDLRAGKFAAVDEVLSQADVTRLGSSVLIAVITITATAKDSLPSRVAFLRRVAPGVDETLIDTFFGMCHTRNRRANE